MNPNLQPLFFSPMKEPFLTELINAIISLPDYIKDAFYFAGFIFMGTFYKIKKQQARGVKTKVTIGWFLSEFLMSSFIALIGLGVLDYMLELPRFLTFAICAFLGSISTTFHDKTEELVVSVFEALKVKIATFFNSK